MQWIYEYSEKFQKFLNDRPDLKKLYEEKNWDIHTLYDYCIKYMESINSHLKIKTNHIPAGGTPIKSSAGGNVFYPLCIIMFARFLILGIHGEDDYDFGELNIQIISKLLEMSKDVIGLIHRMKDYTIDGRIPDMSSVILILAICTKLENEEINRGVYKVLPDICTESSHLFMFLQLC